MITPAAESIQPIDTLDTDTLRTQLMAPNPTQRVMALHAIEREVGHGPAATDPRLAHEVERFAARGMPYYAPNDSHYRAWVDRAVAYWERLHFSPSRPGALASS